MTEPRAIKRYANRKLYDTVDRRYVTLDELAGLIRGGESVVVHDNESGDDITAVTLTQIIHEQAKKATSTPPPGELLHELVRGSGQALVGGVRKLLHGGQRENAERMLWRLVGGKPPDAEGDELGGDEAGGPRARDLAGGVARRAKATSQWVGEQLDTRVKGILDGLGVVTRDELREMLGALEDMKDKLSSLEEERSKDS